MLRFMSGLSSTWCKTLNNIAENWYGEGTKPDSELRDGISRGDSGCLRRRPDIELNVLHVLR